jgi:pimeloyl-ACP methyl ester carboxylesterase
VRAFFLAGPGAVPVYKQRMTNTLWEGRWVEVPGLGRLWSEACGPQDGTAVLLVMGAMNPGLVWPPDLVQALVDGGCRVLRYDHRDTGRSFQTGMADAPYTLDELTEDARRVLDAWYVGTVALVGWSMGGYIAQTLARDLPDRVTHQVLLSSSGDHRPYLDGMMGRPLRGPLPGPAPELLAGLWQLSAQGTQMSPLDRAVQGWMVFHGGSWPFPADRVRQQMSDVLAQGHRPDLAALRHALAVDAIPDARTPWLHELQVPTLVLHGAHDPALPLAHGRALAEAIPGARLQVLDMGHLLPDALAGPVGHEMVRFIRS